MIERELAESEESRMQRKRTSLIASLVASLEQHEKLEAMKSEEEKKGLSRSEILNEIISFLIAGFETTATVLSWFIFSMSKNPRVQQKIKTELRDEYNRYDLSLDRLDSLNYLDCVIKEVLRFYPPTGGTARTLTVDDRLPKSGFQLYEGEQVLIPVSILGKDPHLCGHRQCVGQDLARFELKVIAARLMQYVTFGDGGPDINAGGYVTGLTIKPKQVGITIEFDRDE